MELSRTINSDKRYYLDENTIENAASFLQTMRVFNDAKIDLYNALYDQKYLTSGPLLDHAYPAFLKEKYKTNDYYNMERICLLPVWMELPPYFMILNFQDMMRFFKKNFICKPEKRQALCYNFTVKRDKKNRQYLIVSVTMKLQAYENCYYENGAISMDINYDHFALAEIDETGKLLDQKLIRFDLVKKTTGQITDILGAAVKEVFHWCAEKDKRLIVEDIDLTIKLASRKYGNRKGNHHMTLFAYQRIASSIENQSLRQEIAFCKIDPAYTSQIGKFLFMRRYGISIHQAAAYTIGLVGLGLYDKLVPDVRMLDLLKTKEGIVPEFSQETYKNIWARITTAFSGIQKHFFYRRIPYEVLEERKRPSLRTLAAEMKVRYMPTITNYRSCEQT